MPACRLQVAVSWCLSFLLAALWRLLPSGGDRRREITFVLNVLKARHLLQAFGNGGYRDQRLQRAVLAGKAGELGFDHRVVDGLDHLAYGRDRARRAVRDVA